MTTTLIPDEAWAIYQQEPNATFSNYSVVMWRKAWPGQEYWGWGKTAIEALTAARRNVNTAEEETP